MNIEKEVHDMIKVAQEEQDVEAVEMLHNDSITVDELINFSDVMRQNGYEPRFDFHSINSKQEIMVHLTEIE